MKLFTCSKKTQKMACFFVKEMYWSGKDSRWAFIIYKEQMSIYSDHTEYLINITWRNFVKLIPVINTVNIYNYPTCLTYRVNLTSLLSLLAN